MAYAAAAARRLSAVVAFLAALLAAGPAAFAAKPTLEPVETLPKTLPANGKQTFVLRFRDADGDRPTKSVFVDTAPSGTTETPATITGEGNTADGITLQWDLRNFEQGAHRAYFEVRASDGNVVRYPAAEEGTYQFVAESIVTKWLIMAGGAFVGLAFLPYLVYMLARSANRGGDPSKAARGGLLLGILACGALFIYLFASFYGALAIGIGVIAALAGMVLVLTRR